MPRGSKKSAHQHNTRHETGVVAPGKRIRKQKSSTHLNGALDAVAPADSTPHPSSPKTPPTSLQDKSLNGSAHGVKPEMDGVLSAGLEKKPSQQAWETADTPMKGTAHANGFVEPSHRKIDLNAAKNPTIHDTGALHLASTILRSCPLGDTIAILIFLLSLPPTLLSLTNALFAALTFMPPAASFSSFPATLSDVFQGSGGTPSLATIILTDMLGLIVWLVIWAPLQTLALELAQAVVANTLGGGNSNKSGGTDTTLLCMIIVSLTHIARQRWNAKRLFSYEWSAHLFPMPFGVRKPDLPFEEDTIVTRSPAGWLRVLVALHVLIQGLVHVARRWYTNREYMQSSPPTKKSDFDGLTGSSTTSDSVSVSNSGGPSALLPELKPKSSLSSIKEQRERVSTGKKKRKQGTYVRSQQPLWAAFAATKVTILREYEQSHALSDAVGSNATDTKNLGSAPFRFQEGQIWITDVQPTSFYFETSSFPPRPPDLSEEKDEDPETADSVGTDYSKPIYVRINGANWPSTAIERLSEAETSNERENWRWEGEVFGLSPASTYNCSFVRSQDGVVVHCLSVTTPSLPIAEKGI